MALKVINDFMDDDFLEYDILNEPHVAILTQRVYGLVYSTSIYRLDSVGYVIGVKLYGRSLGEDDARLLHNEAVKRMDGYVVETDWFKPGPSGGQELYLSKYHQQQEGGAV